AQLDHLLREPAINRLTEPQPRVRTLTLAAVSRDQGDTQLRTRRGDPAADLAPPLTTVHVAIPDLQRAVRPPIDALVAEDRHASLRLPLRIERPWPRRRGTGAHAARLFCRSPRRHASMYSRLNHAFPPLQSCSKCT